MIRAWWLVLVLLATASGAAHAHKFDSAFLALTELGGMRYGVRMKLPLTGGRPGALPDLQLPADCQDAGTPRTQHEAQSWRRSWTVHCEATLRGRSLKLSGLNAVMPNAVVALRFEDGAERVLLIDLDQHAFVFAPGQKRQSAAAAEYLPLGITHILGGPDHLLFVAGLLLVVVRARAGMKTMVGTITAFTVAHSITLAAAVLGHASLPATPVETVIALSILLLAVELSAASGQEEPPGSLTFRRPWLVAFGFGLVHGFGFAGALREVGLPEHAVGQALLLFNVGVEIGQLLFVAALLAAGGLLNRLRPSLLPPTTRAMVLGIGALGAYWVIERTYPALAGS